MCPDNVKFCIKDLSTCIHKHAGKQNMHTRKDGRKESVGRKSGNSQGENYRAMMALRIISPKPKLSYYKIIPHFTNFI